MNRAEFNLAMQGELRCVLNKFEKERDAVRYRNTIVATAPVFAGGSAAERIEAADRGVTNAGEQLDMAIYAFCDCLYDLAKGEDSE